MSNFLCSFCAAYFDSAAKLKDHRKIHDDTIYKCNICSKDLKGAKAMQNHKVSHETYTCEKCNSVMKKSSKKSHKAACLKETPELLKNAIILKLSGKLELPHMLLEAQKV